MKKLLLLTSLLPLAFLAHAQPDCEYTKNGATLESHRMAVRINTDGTLFHHEGEGFFKNPYFGEGSPTTIRKAGLWVGGFEAGTNFQVLKMAAAAVDSEDNASDFYPGPLQPQGKGPYINIPCDYMNWVWKVTKEEIIGHLKDYLEDGIIDDPIPSVIHWPGNGNPNFWWGNHGAGLPDTEQGWAPFFDRNYDGIYNAYDGDFPAISENGAIPREIYWTVFNDIGNGQPHEVSGGDPLMVEVQLTGWTTDCPSNRWVEDMLFTEYKIINRALTDLDSIYAGIWVDFDLGCPEDDYLGSMPGRRSFYAYNADPVDGGPDGTCSDGRYSYEEYPPVMSVSIDYYRDADMTSFMYYYDDDVFGAGKAKPTNANEFYRYLSGTWKDGTPLTVGDDGYDPGGSGELANFAFPDNPGLEDGWSMINENMQSSKMYAVGGMQRTDFFTGERGYLQRGSSMKFYVAYGYHRPNPLNHVEIVDRISGFELKEVFDVFTPLYSHYPSSPCFYEFWVDEGKDESEPKVPSVQIYPNPTTGNITISYTGEAVYEVAIYNANRFLVYFDNEIDENGKIKLDLSQFHEGLYYVRLTVDGTVFEEKLVVF